MKLDTLVNVDLWPGANSPRLKIINEEDFPEREILKGLEIADSPLRSSFGITDEVAIAGRLELVQYLHTNPEVAQFLRELLPDKGLPATEERFLEAFPQGSRSLFWLQVSGFINAVAVSSNPPKALLTLVSRLKSILPFESDERQVVEKIAQAVKKMAYAKALLRLPLTITHGRDREANELHAVPSIATYSSGERSRLLSLYGGRMYGDFVSAEVDKSRVAEMQYGRRSERIRRWFTLILLGLTRGIRKRKSLRVNIIAPTHQSVIVDDVSNALMARFKSCPVRDRMLKDYYVYTDVVYDETGMTLKVVGVQYEPAPVVESKAEKEAKKKHKTRLDLIRGFSRGQRRAIKRGERRTLELENQFRPNIMAGELAHEIGRNFFEFGGHYELKIPSPRTDKAYKWGSISTLYVLEEYRPVTEQMKAYRGYFYEHAKLLKDVLHINDTLVRRATEYGIPVCVPEMVEGHTISGQGLVPTQLMFQEEEKKGKRRRLVAMHGMPELNGQMIALTGRHGGGKTEILHSVPANVYLAQSGLLVLGNKFKFNPKKALGLLFITQRGNGSTIEIIVQKLNKILKEIKKYAPHEAVVVLDELGTATQEGDGQELAQRVLETLHDSHVSVMFSSQILELVRWSHKKLGAITVWVDERHRIRTGIEDGGLKSLVIRTGLEKELGIANR